jgi:hypothetical protein
VSYNYAVGRNANRHRQRISLSRVGECRVVFEPWNISKYSQHLCISTRYPHGILECAFFLLAVGKAYGEYVAMCAEHGGVV